MITLREREMKRDVSNNKRITSFRVKIQEPSSGKKETDQRVIKSHLQLIDERGDGDDIVRTTTTTTAIHFQSSRRGDGGRDFAHRWWSRGVRHLFQSLFCFVFSFVLCVSSRFLWGCFVGKSSKKASTSFKTDTTKQSGDCDKIRGKERERE